MPRPRNTRIRPKNTGRADARRRHRDEQRALAEPNTLAEDATKPAEEAAPQRPLLAMPNVVEDIRALPQVFRTPWVWLPFGLLLVAALIVLAFEGDGLPEGVVRDLAVLYVQFAFGFPPLLVLFIGGFVAPRASYMVGGLLGAFYMLLVTVLVMIESANLDETGLSEVTGGQATLETIAPYWAMSILMGMFAAGFAAWYRRFLRSSQERAKANRMAREQEQARKAKEQAREDRQREREQKYEARETRRKSAGR